MPTSVQKNLAALDIGSVAVVAERNQINGTVSGGVAFARAMRGGRPEKDRARDALWNYILPERFPNPIKILTMPGYTWGFERHLISLRGGRSWKEQRTAPHTRIVGVEGDEMVYRASLKRIPGIEFGVEVMEPNAMFETAAIKTPMVSAYRRCLFEDYASVTRERFDFVWIDLNGPLTEPRIAAIRRLWATNVKSVLAVTSLRARWDSVVSRQIRNAGGLPNLLERELRSEPVEVMEYADAAPMTQIVWQK